MLLADQHRRLTKPQSSRRRFESALISDYETGSSEVASAFDAQASYSPAPWCPHPSPIRVLGSGSSDPFAAASISVTSAVHELIQWSRAWYVHSLWPVEVSEHDQSSAVVSWRRNMEEGVQNEAFFHAILAQASSYMAATRLHALETSVLLQKGLRHKILSLANLQRRLRKNPTDINTLLAIVTLGGAEFYDGNVETTVLHLEAASRIVNANGGLKKVSADLRSLIGIADSVTSWLLLRRPVFPIYDWDPGTWSKHSLSQLYFLDAERQGQHTGPRWDGDINSQVPKPFLRSMLAELQELVSIQNLAISVDDRQHRNDIFRWLHVRRSAIKTHLLYHYLEVTHDTGSINLDDGLEAATCLAAWYCHGFIVYESLPIHFPPQLLHQGLKTSLREAEIVPYTTHSRLLLWLYFVGATIEELFADCLPDRGQKYFTVRFLATAERLELTSFNSVREVLRYFLFDGVLDECLVSLLAVSERDEVVLV
jgi:hypothetical protein